MLVIDSNCNNQTDFNLDILFSPFEKLAQMVQGLGEKLIATMHNKEQKELLELRFIAYTNPGKIISSRNLFGHNTLFLPHFSLEKREVVIIQCKTDKKSLEEKIDHYSDMGKKVYLDFDHRNAKLLVTISTEKKLIQDPKIG